MNILTGQALVTTLRRLVDQASHRLWIASPYVGGWAGNVRRILGTRWHTAVKDVRLLTDVECRGIKVSTAQQFLRRGAVRTRLGLHAKIYIVDEVALVTSANLTGTAFSKRYEIGCLLSGPPAQEVIRHFETWWQESRAVMEENIDESSSSTGDPDAIPFAQLPTLVDLPPDVKDVALPADTFGDYDAFLQAFDNLRRAYVAVQRLWPHEPLAYELDAFLNYLYHHSSRPSVKYGKKRPRSLTLSAQATEIRRHARGFAAAYRAGELGNESSSWRTQTAIEVRRLLTQNAKRGLSRSAIKNLLLNLNSMKSYQVNLAKALNPENNNLKQIQEMLRTLVDESIPPQRRMSDCTEAVFAISKSSIQELMGFYYRGKLPLRNRNTNCGLRYLGFDVRVD